MKRLFSILLALCLLLSLAACASGSGSAESADTEAGGQSQRGGFRVGFGRMDVTPKDSVPMASYGNARQRMSEGIFTYLYINVLAIDDGENTMLALTIDHSWFNNTLTTPIRMQITKDFGIPDEYIFTQGTHTHGGPEVGLTDIPAMAQSNTRTIEQTMKAVQMALDDLKPAEVYVGSVETEGMNFVRRYYMDDGSLSGDNFAGTGTKRVAHETEADGEMQLMKFVREGGKDILIANFQAHPHLEGKTLNLSSQNVGAFREAIEKKLDIYSIYWQGAAGNLNSTGSLEGEKPYATRDEYGTALANYAASVYDSLEKVASGPIKVSHRTVICRVNHAEDHLVNQAQKIKDYFTETNNASEGQKMGAPYGIRSVYHANAILEKAKMGATNEMPISAFSFGDVSAVIVPYEMFDTSGMQIKDATPFAKTFIFCYANTGNGGYSYMPDEKAFENVGYEGNQCRYEKGTAEQLVAEYLDMLKEMRGS